MAILTGDQMLERFRGFIGESTSDDTLAFLDDVKETVDSYANNDNWKAKYEENDAEWRKRYRDRFFDGTTAPPEKDKDDDKTNITIDELFT